MATRGGLTVVGHFAAPAPGRAHGVGTPPGPSRPGARRRPHSSSPDPRAARPEDPPASPHRARPHTSVEVADADSNGSLPLRPAGTGVSGSCGRSPGPFGVQKRIWTRAEAAPYNPAPSSAGDTEWQACPRKLCSPVSSRHWSGRLPLIILPHDNPDPDALASAAALRFLARELADKEATIALGGTSAGPRTAPWCAI